MEYRFLGRSGLKVSVLSLGGWVTFGKQTDQDTTNACIKAAYDAGINFFDNAEVYGDGASEKAMGDAFKKFGWKRSDLVVSTKIYWGGKGPNDKGLSRKHIIEGLKKSLERLQMDYVDLVFAHRPDSLTPMEETVRAFNWVIDKGYAFYWGTSEWSAEQIADAHRIADRLGLIGPLMEQPQYNMFHRDRFEVEYAPLYEKFGLGTTIWSPLASGILSGKYNSGVIPEGSRLTLDEDLMKSMKDKLLNTEDGRSKIKKVKEMESIAKELGCTQAQLALAWCAKNPNVSTVITGASRPEQVKENVKAVQVIAKLTPEIMEKIDKILENKPTPATRRF
ncbi:NADP-dependent oxidoreductase domain-containing protein [Phlyctochytrium arcticum]|nr:NADP-dependent oxidoreductase domain-containing protein [Phlyctochytrium arcticum]